MADSGHVNAGGRAAQAFAKRPGESGV